MDEKTRYSLEERAWSVSIDIARIYADAEEDPNRSESEIYESAINVFKVTFGFLIIPRIEVLRGGGYKIVEVWCGKHRLSRLVSARGGVRGNENCTY